MSSLIFQISDYEVVVATDTLATSVDGTPLYFTSKVCILPRLRMMIAGTGAAGFLDQWFLLLNGPNFAMDIDEIDPATPDALANLWDFYKRNLQSDAQLTTSVFHFGFSNTSNKIHAFTYHSGDGFKSTPIDQGLRAKPVFESAEVFRLPNDAMKMMNLQRQWQSDKPKADRVFIGGEVQIVVLGNDGFSIYSGGFFDDYAEHFKLISGYRSG